MKTRILLISIIIVGLVGVVLYVVFRQPAVRQDLHLLGEDLEQGAQKAYDASAAAATKVKDAVR